MEKGGRASLSGPLVHPLEKLLSFAGVGMDRFGEDPADGVRVEADLGEQFVTCGEFEVEVTVDHGLVSCSGELPRSRHRDRETVSLFPAGRLPGPCFPLTRRTVTGTRGELRGRDGRRQPLADLARSSPSPGCRRTRTRSGLRAVRVSSRIRRMDDQGLIKRRGFWLLALLWLPAGVVATAAGPEVGPGMWLSMLLMSTASLMAGLLGPIVIAVYARVLSLLVWVAWWWLARRG